MGANTIFLSAVSKEFKTYRDELAHALTRRGFLVKVQEDFTAHDGSLLEKLEAYIKQCDAVICLIGDRYGWAPEPVQAQPFAHMLEDGDQDTNYSYTQWEYIMGKRLGKSVYVFYPDADALRDNPDEQSGEERQLQADYRETWIEKPGIDHTPFADPASLKEEVLVIPSLNPSTSVRVADKVDLANPYIGLRKFEEADQEKFFGRTTLTDEILAQINATPLLTIFGNSGSGKSSVVRAGVIPKWRKQNPTGKVIVFHPDKNPFTSLSYTLGAAGLPRSLADQAAGPSPTIFRDLLEGEALSEPTSPAPWLIFIDQFEEIFTRPAKQDAPLILQFVQSLIDVSRASRSAQPPGTDQEPRVTIVLAMRDDFIGELREFKDLAAICDQNLVRVTAPSGEELREIIEVPAANHGVRYEGDLVSRIANHVEDQAGRLPLLQYTLELLWETEVGQVCNLSTSTPPRQARDRLQTYPTIAKSPAPPTSK